MKIFDLIDQWFEDYHIFAAMITIFVVYLIYRQCRRWGIK